MNKPISSPTQSTPKINQFNYHSHPTKTLIDVLNSDFRILSFEISQHGRTGVFFIQTSEGSFVMKSSNQGPKDEFLNRLAGMLSLSVPQSVCYCCSEPIFHKLMFQIERYCEKDQMLYARIKTKLDFPFYQILEYVPSISLAEIGQERFQTHLLDQTKLYTLGMCLGFDIIVNNSDRFALLWSSSGNINNVLVQIQDHDTHQMKWIKDRSNTSVGLGNFVFIDHSGYLLDLKNPLAAKNFDNYMVRVADFLVKLIRAISQEKELPSQQFQKLKKQVALYSHYVLTDFDLRTISHGIIYIIKKFLELFESKAIEQLYSNLKKQHKKQKKGDQQSSYWYSYWNTELSRVNIFFLQEVYTKIAAIFTTYPETIEKIIEDVGDIDQQVGNANFNDMNEILDVKASMAGKKPEKEEESQPPSKLDIPSDYSVPPAKNEEPDKVSEHKEDPIKEVEEQQEQSQHPQEEFNQQRPVTPPKVRKWREKLNKFKQANQKQAP